MNDYEQKPKVPRLQRRGSFLKPQITEMTLEDKVKQMKEIMARRYKNCPNMECMSHIRDSNKKIKQSMCELILANLNNHFELSEED